MSIKLQPTPSSETSYQSCQPALQKSSWSVRGLATPSARMQLATLCASALGLLALSLGLSACTGTMDIPAEQEDDIGNNTNENTNGDLEDEISDDELAAFGQTCAADEECTSGACFEGNDESYCSIPCDPNLAEQGEPNPDCAEQEGADGTCNGQGYCKIAQMPEGELAAFGQMCTADEECASGACFEGNDRSYCSVLCDPNLAEQGEPNPDCAEQEGADGTCNGQGYCRVAEELLDNELAAFGETCAADEDCVTGTCFVGGNRTYCSTLCDASLAEQGEPNPDCAEQEGADGTCNDQGYCRAVNNNAG